MDAFGLIGGIMPALGIAMLLQYLNKPKLTPFFFLGFALSEFFGLTTMMVAVVGAILAVLLYNRSDTAGQSSELAGA